MSTAALNQISIVLPSTRADGSALPITDIASFTLSKAAGTGTAVALATVSGPFTSTTQSFQDTSPDAGETDNYSCVVTDVEGNTSAAGTASVVVPPSQLAPPAAPTLTATYVPATA